MPPTCTSGTPRCRESTRAAASPAVGACARGAAPNPSSSSELTLPSRSGSGAFVLLLVPVLRPGRWLALVGHGTGADRVRTWCGRGACACRSSPQRWGPAGHCAVRSGGCVACRWSLCEEAAGRDPRCGGVGVGPCRARSSVVSGGSARGPRTVGIVEWAWQARGLFGSPVGRRDAHRGLMLNGPHRVRSRSEVGRERAHPSR
jgi:hypothetical protein